jgi:hypothetical protein
MALISSMYCSLATALVVRQFSTYSRVSSSGRGDQQQQQQFWRVCHSVIHTRLEKDLDVRMLCALFCRDRSNTRVQVCR